MPNNNTSLDDVKLKLLELVEDVTHHDGYGEIKIEVKILKRQQKEIILHYGKQYRFVIDAPNAPQIGISV